MCAPLLMVSVRMRSGRSSAASSAMVPPIDSPDQMEALRAGGVGYR